MAAKKKTARRPPAARPVRVAPVHRSRREAVADAPRRYTLMLEGDPREIDIRMKLTDSDGDRRIRENLESYRHLVMVEASKFNPAYVPGAMPDGAWLMANKGYIDVVLALSHMREIARQLVASVSRFIDSDPDRAAQPVTKFHLELGMRQQFLAVTILHLMSVNARG